MAPEPEPSPSPNRTPWWMCALAGWLLASSQFGSADARVDASACSARIPAGARRPVATDPDRMSARELRRLPAIGPARALAIVRARWRSGGSGRWGQSGRSGESGQSGEPGLSGGPESWEDLPGIGPETVRAIRRALDEAAQHPRAVRSP